MPNCRIARYKNDNSCGLYSLTQEICMFVWFCWFLLILIANIYYFFLPSKIVKYVSKLMFVKKNTKYFYNSDFKLKYATQKL